MNKFQLNTFPPDFKFYIDGSIYKCESSTIACVSPLICKLINSYQQNFLEYRFFDLKDPNKAFKLFMDLLKGVEIDISKLNAPFLNEISRILQIPSLQQVTEKYTNVQVDQTNAIELLEIYSTYNIKCPKVTNFICSNWVRYEKSDQIMQLSLSALNLIFSDNSFRPTNTTALFDLICSLVQKDHAFSSLFQYCETSQLTYDQISRLIDIISFDTIPSNTIESLGDRFVQTVEIVNEDDKEYIDQISNSINKYGENNYINDVISNQTQQMHQIQQQPSQMQSQQISTIQQMKSLPVKPFSAIQQNAASSDNLFPSNATVTVVDQMGNNNNNSETVSTTVISGNINSSNSNGTFGSVVREEIDPEFIAKPITCKFYPCFDEDETVEGVINHMKNMCNSTDWLRYVQLNCGGDKISLLPHLFDYDINKIYEFHWDNYSKNGIKIENAWISIAFPYHKLLVKEYTLGVSWITSGPQPKSWRLEASNDGKTWELIATERNSLAFKTKKQRLCSFSSKTKKAFSHFKFVFTDNYARPSAKNASEIRINLIEFYGTLSRK